MIKTIINQLSVERGINLIATSHLHWISEKGRISPSQFHTETDGVSLQQGPQKRAFLPLQSPLSLYAPLPLSVSCCWDPVLLLVSMSITHCVSWFSRSPVAPLSMSSHPSSSSPGGREKRNAFTRCTSTKGRSNCHEYRAENHVSPTLEQKRCHKRPYGIQNYIFFLNV